MFENGLIYCIERERENIANKSFIFRAAWGRIRVVDDDRGTRQGSRDTFITHPRKVNANTILLDKMRWQTLESKPTEPTELSCNNFVKCVDNVGGWNITEKLNFQYFFYMMIEIFSLQLKRHIFYDRSDQLTRRRRGRQQQRREEMWWTQWKIANS